MKPSQKLIERLSGRASLICLQAMDDMPEDMSRDGLQVQEGVAIVDVCGVLGNDADCCGTSYEDIQEEIAQAEADSSVRGVILNVRSPGGYTDGVFECGAAIAAMKKPCWAVANPMAYSGAYWLASQTKKIYVPSVSGGVGSIGVYCAHLDMSGMLAQMGLVVTLISAGKGKTDGNPYEPLSDDARKKYQADVNRLYGEFVGAVSRGRGLPPQDIIGQLGADLYEGAKAAIGAGLADAAGDLATAWVDMVSSFNRSSASVMVPGMSAQASSAASAARTPSQEKKMAEQQQAAADHPTPTAAEIEGMVANASKAGRKEASIIAAMCAVAGKSDLVAGFLASEKTAEQVAAELMSANVAAEKGTELNTTVQAGKDAAKLNEPQGKAKPWGDVMKSLGCKKEAK